MSFICDFCGTFGDRTPYLCTTCNLIVHKNCISLPLSLATTQHQHPISHSYYLRGNQIEEMKCKICYKEVDTRYGSYSCSASDCNYIAHVKCATDSKIWGGETGDLRFEGGSMIDVIEEENLGEGVIATKIKHAYHNKHELILTLSDEKARCYGNCGACMKPISAPDPLYGCSQCGRFFLHKSCAELPRKKRHPSHKHPLVLRKNASCCTACNRFHHGFNYKCDRRSCEFVLDVQCSSLSHILEHPSHEHRLFLDHNYHGNCNGCGNEIRSSSSGPSLGYKCVEGCPFALDFSCLTLPLEAWFKYEEKHPLTLTYNDGSDPNQCYCDICEEERDPKQWFYCCENCDTTLHRDCILGDLPLVKLGERLKIAEHKHPVTFVKKIWNCPPCDVCRKLCNLQALECGEPKCNFIIHWKCHGAASTYGRVPKYFPVKVRRKDWMFSLMEYQVSHNLTDCSYIEHVKYATYNNICGLET